MRRSVVPEWISGYQTKWLPVDLVAGLTVAALVVPEGMAYAQLAIFAGVVSVLAGWLKLGPIARGVRD